MSSATRMLVLGSIRILQPVHGYDVRRELLTWRLDEIANVKPGSIYGAMRTLEKDGCIAVHSRESGERKPKRTMYMLTGEGDKEFLLMLRAAWWTVTAPTEPLIPALCLMPFMDRDELVRALQARLGRLEGELDSTAFSRRSIRTGASGADGEVPDHVREIFEFRTAHLRAELDWTRGLQKRLREGAYRFSGEEGFPRVGPGLGIQGTVSQP